MQQPEIVIANGPINQTRTLPSGIEVRRYGIISTDLIVYNAWAPIDGTLLGAPYSTITHRGERWLGQLGTERLPADLDALPAYSQVRAERVGAWQAERKRVAREAIAEAFPEARAAAAHGNWHDVTRTVPGAGRQGKYENWLGLDPTTQQISDELDALQQRAARQQEIA